MQKEMKALAYNLERFKKAQEYSYAMALSEINQGQIMFGGEGELDPIKVGIGQFYGIEINDFAVTVARTALWIAESQMMQETEEIVHRNLDFLSTSVNISNS